MIMILFLGNTSTNQTHTTLARTLTASSNENIAAEKANTTFSFPFLHKDHIMKRKISQVPQHLVNLIPVITVSNRHAGQGAAENQGEMGRDTMEGD
jgi:hypothetical protein